MSLNWENMKIYIPVASIHTFPTLPLVYNQNKSTWIAILFFIITGAMGCYQIIIYILSYHLYLHVITAGKSEKCALKPSIKPPIYLSTYFFKLSFINLLLLALNIIVLIDHLIDPSIHRRRLIN